MQILRQVQLQKLSTDIILFRIIRNKLLCLTEYQLVVIHIQNDCPKTQIPYNGTSVKNLELSKDYVAILERGGRLEIRRLDNIKTIVFVKQNVKISNLKYPKLKWWQQDLHLVYQNGFQRIFVRKANVNISIQEDKSKSKKNKILGSSSAEIQNNNMIQTNQDQITLVQNTNHSQIHTIPLFNKTKTSNKYNNKQKLIHIEFFNLFTDETKTLFCIMNLSIEIYLDNLRIGRLDYGSDGYEIKQALRLCHPFQEVQIPRQYLVVLAERGEGNINNNSTNVITRLQIFEIFTMQIVFQKLLPSIDKKTQQIKLSTDDLNQYLLIKYLNINKNHMDNRIQQIQSQTLMKINKQHYYDKSIIQSQDTQKSQKSQQSNKHNNSPEPQKNPPFFLFDIEIGLKKNLQIFPSHSQNINGLICNSIDTCYFEKNQIFIASIVIDAKYKDKICKKSFGRQYVNKQGFEVQARDMGDMVVWREIVKMKQNPNKFMEGLVKKIRAFKSTNSQGQEIQEKNPYNNNCQSNKVSQIPDQKEDQNHFLSTLIKFLNNKNYQQNTNFLQSKWSGAYKFLSNQIYTADYIPYLVDQLPIKPIQKNINKKRTFLQILQKSNEDSKNTRSGFSSSQQCSPKSVNSNCNSNQSEKLGKNVGKILDEEVIGKNYAVERKGQTKEQAKNKQCIYKACEIRSKTCQVDFCCQQCQQIQHQDQYNLKTLSSIIQSNSSLIQTDMQTIQQKIYNIQHLTLNRLKNLQIYTKKQKIKENSVCALIKDQFQLALNNMRRNVLGSAERFRQRLGVLENGTLRQKRLQQQKKSEQFKLTKNQQSQKIKLIKKNQFSINDNKPNQFLSQSNVILTQPNLSSPINHQQCHQTIKTQHLAYISQTRQFYQSQLKHHNQNYNQLLDYLYDIQFPQV